MKWSIRFGIAALVLATASGCGRDDDEHWEEAEMLHGATAAQRTQLSKGRGLYQTYCVGCHGVSGDGKGPAARFLDPSPRDLRKGRVKFAAVPPGTLPRDEDLLRTLEHGLAGTSMPSWELLSQDDRLALTAYIKRFHDGYAKKGSGPEVTVPPDPFRKEPARGIAEGERVYHGLAQCSGCHPNYVPHARVVVHLQSFGLEASPERADAFDSISKDSEWGAPIRPPDFLFDRIKTGTDRENLARVISTGIGGTAMPAWGRTLTPEQLWGLSYYVESLAILRDSRDAVAMRKRLLGKPDSMKGTDAP